MERYLLGTISSYGKENDLITNVWDYVMINYKCCGVYGFKDFENSHWQKTNPEIPYPVQCCKIENVTAQLPIYKECPVGNQSDLYTNKEIGCLYSLRMSITNNKGRLIFYMILLGVLYLLVMFFSYCLIRGEPLISSMTRKMATYLPQKAPSNINMRTANSSLENMMFVEEPPKKIVKVVSAVNPFLTYKVEPNMYCSGDLGSQRFRN